MNSLTVRSKRIRYADAVDGREAQAGRPQAVPVSVDRLQQRLLDADLLLGVERHGPQLAALVDRNRRVVHAPVVGAGGGEHEPLDSERRGRPSPGPGCPPRSRRWRARGRGRRPGRRRWPRDARPRRRPRGRAGAASASRMSPRISSTPRSVEVLGHVLLPVQQHVEHADVASGAEQLVHDERADIAGSACDGDRHGATGLTGAWPAAGWLERCVAGGSLAVFSFISRGLTCSNSRIAFS